MSEVQNLEPEADSLVINAEVKPRMKLNLSSRQVKKAAIEIDTSDISISDDMATKSQELNNNTESVGVTSVANNESSESRQEQRDFSQSDQDRRSRYRDRGDRNDRSNNDRNEQGDDFVINRDQVMYLKDLQVKNLDELIKTAEEYEVQNLNHMLRYDMIAAILKQGAARGFGLYCEGILNVTEEGFGFLHYAEDNYKPCMCDVYLSAGSIKKFSLRSGDSIGGFVRVPRKMERCFSIVSIETVNGKAINEIKNKVNFDNLVPLYPSERLKFDPQPDSKDKFSSTRAIDLISPIGKGQRALISAPPRTGKTILLQNIANAITANNPEVHLIVLLIGERPEEVTDMQRSVKGQVISSTFDEPGTRHVQVAEITIERAKRMVESGMDVVILLDSITRLARAYNAVAPSSGRVLTGGVDSNALQKPKSLFGAARNIENGGSLTIIATALIDTGSKMEEVIFEEFKGTGNSEIVLDRKAGERRVFPAIDISKSGTRKEEEMINKEDLAKMWILRRILLNMPGNVEALEFLLNKIRGSDNNTDLFQKMNS